MTNDPTYERQRIHANPVWDLAFALSEQLNDTAPIGWGTFIYIASEIMDDFDVKRKNKE